MTDEGTLQTSHREMSQLRLKHVNKSLHDLVLQFMEEHLEDHCIRQRLQADKEQIVKRGQFYVLPNTSRAEPGFLLFLPNQPAVWTTMRSSERGRKPAAFSLRMRTDVTLGNGGGSVLIASLDKISHTLRLEDVYVWRGDSVFKNQPFSQRRTLLQEFVEHSWTPDARLMGGIQTTVANPLPLQSLCALTDSPYSIELIPELAGKRRFYFLSEQNQTPVQSLELPPAKVVSVPVEQTTQKMNAYAVPLDSLPDVYDLFMENGTPLCRAAVQQLALSQELRAAAAKSEKIPVSLAWNKEFGRYEIIAKLPGM